MAQVPKLNRENIKKFDKKYPGKLNVDILKDKKLADVTAQLVMTMGARDFWTKTSPMVPEPLFMDFVRHLTGIFQKRMDPDLDDPDFEQLYTNCMSYSRLAQRGLPTQRLDEMAEERSEMYTNMMNGLHDTIQSAIQMLQGELLQEFEVCDKQKQASVVHALYEIWNGICTRKNKVILSKMKELFKLLPDLEFYFRSANVDFETSEELVIKAPVKAKKDEQKE